MGFLSKKIFRLYIVYAIFFLVNIFFHDLAFAQNGINISGVITDSHTKLPLQGVSISVSGTKNSVFSNKEGSYSILVQGQSKSLMFSTIGYKNKTIVISKDLSALNVELEPDSKNIDEVVVTGMFNIRKESFTGASKMISAAEISSVGNKNVLQALKALDPSLNFVENNLNGSNPNTLAQIELRGKTSVYNELSGSYVRDQLEVDPNQPLFILDGFESSLRQITDLDINRISTVTILKDAASTALYGAKAANGVIVVETIKPKEGEIRVSYNADFNFNIADLSDFNLMNAKEKLEFERLSGRYTASDNRYQHLFDNLYNDRLKKVVSGVDTYWLNVPIEPVSIENRHSIQASGGSSQFQYNVGANYQDINGVLKGSGRKNWGANVDLVYRTNKLNILNKAFVSGNKSEDSPYGSFSNYARMNPYYEKGDFTKRYLEEVPVDLFTNRFVANPLYNSSLNNESYQNQFQIGNNLGFNYDIDRDLRFSGAFQISRGLSNSIRFVSPLHTDFDSTPIMLKGSYSDETGNSNSYSANLSSTYSKHFKEKHVITANIRGEFSESGNKTKEFTAVGFPVGVEANPAFAYSYQNNSKPTIFNPPLIRRVGGLASVNYYFDNKYFFDGLYRIEGATAFGSENLYSPFWSVGLGWNLHKEKFVKAMDFINRMVLRGNVGTTGNQSFGTFYSTTVYSLNQQTNYFGLGYYHNDLKNPALEWQKTKQSSVGLDLVMFRDRLSLTIDAYDKLTDPLIVNIDLSPSQGASSFPINSGALKTRGLEFQIGYSPIINLEKRITWKLNFSGAVSRGEYSKFGEMASKLNTEQLKSTSLLRYEDGRSPDDIWGLKSIGIDPGTGREMFLTVDDSYTYDYTQARERVVGSQRPLIQGIFNSNLRIKNFNASIFIRYNFGAYRFNQALYSKVENISSTSLDFNQDKRALEMRWKEPGDISAFKAINNTSYTPISSRFIQRENIISGESFSVGYEFTEGTHPWIKKAGMSRLNLGGYMNDIFRISNILNERGVDYPFARSISFSLRASF